MDTGNKYFSDLIDIKNTKCICQLCGNTGVIDKTTEKWFTEDEIQSMKELRKHPYIDHNAISDFVPIVSECDYSGKHNIPTRGIFRFHLCKDCYNKNFTVDMIR